MTFREVLVGVQDTWPYMAVLIFFAFYPVVSSLIWVSTSLLYFFRWERHSNQKFYDMEAFPLVTVLVPTYCEGKIITKTIEGLLNIDYPFKEIVLIDDGSTDDTVECILPFVREEKVRLIRKKTNEGKAMALNDALPVINGEIVFIMDADAYPDRHILRWMVPHFQSPRVAGVTGNPRVANRHTFLAKLQLVEFASIVSLLRRAQRIWGRILTMSGVVGAFRRSALIDAGLFSPEMATEDIDMTWKLQRRFHDIRFEPRALVWMQAPATLNSLFRQRIRWAKGLAQVLKRNDDLFRDWRFRRHWPVMIEAVVSIFWAYCMVILTGLWTLSYLIGYPPVGVSPIPNWWGMLIGTTCLLQLLVGVLLDRRYDKEVPQFYYVAVFYPIIYWVLMAVVTSIATPMGLASKIKPGTVTRWHTPREPTS